jgi:hypothetical protein
LATLFHFARSDGNVYRAAAMDAEQFIRRSVSVIASIIAVPSGRVDVVVGGENF